MLQLLSKQRRLSQQWPTTLRSTPLPAAAAALLELLECWRTQPVVWLPPKQLCLLLGSAACLQRWLELLSLQVTQTQQVTNRPLHSVHACKLSAATVLWEPLVTFRFAMTSVSNISESLLSLTTDKLIYSCVLAVLYWLSGSLSLVPCRGSQPVQRTCRAWGSGWQSVPQTADAGLPPWSRPSCRATWAW